MQKHLAQDLQTAKTKSLPDDLKSLAEELIGTKFGYEEEVVEQSTASFQGYTVGVDAAYGRDVSAFREPRDGRTTSVRKVMDSEVYERIDFYTRSRIISTPIDRPTTRSFRDAVYRLDMVNARRDDRRAYLPVEFARELFRSADFQYYAEQRIDRGMGYDRSEGNYIGRLFGVEVFAKDEHMYLDRIVPEIVVKY